MIVTLSGENSFALRQRLNELVETFVKRFDSLGLERVDAEEIEVERIIESIQALPFLSAHKMVVIRNGSANKIFAEQIEQIISSIPDSTELILYEPQLDRRSSYFKVLKSKTSFEEFNQLDRKDLAKWLVEEAKRQGAKIALVDANYLVERIGENQEMLYNELSKLVLYDADISKENMNLLTEPTPQSRVFDLLDAAFGGHQKRALKLYADQRAQKVEPQAILAMITWQLQLLTLIKFAEGKRTTEIAKHTGINPYPLRKASDLANRITDEELRRLVNEAYEIDLKSKTTPLDLDEALKTYITTL